jgi:prepilin-type N-terminal cleavage/methylation domain-containing protein
VPKIVTHLIFYFCYFEVKDMNNKQSGFSLIELLIVVVMLGILSTVAIPYLLKAVYRSEESNVFASLRTMSSAQVNYLSQKGRFARLDELNAAQGNGLGNINGSGQLIRGKFTFQMSPAPTDAELKQEYTIVATRPAINNEPPLTLTLDQTGRITGLFNDF